jgi:hypothetical protein
MSVKMARLMACGARYSSRGAQWLSYFRRRREAVRGNRLERVKLNCDRTRERTTQCARRKTRCDGQPPRLLEFYYP